MKSLDEEVILYAGRGCGQVDWRFDKKEEMMIAKQRYQE